ncbi:MAG: Crp/Fnr family transcriptional regulator [Thermoleophilaceae bacterium]
MAVQRKQALEPFLEHLTAEEQASLRSRAVNRRFARGATIMHQGEAPGRVLVIERGRAKITAVTDDGSEVVLAFRGPGELLGELSALGGEPRLATVRALEPLDALALSAGDFDAFLESNPRVALVILRVVIARLRQADRQQIEMASYQTLGRVSLRLVELAERFGEPVDGGLLITLPITQDELAGWAGASREATSKALRDLRELGLVETRRRNITVRDLDALRKLVS